MFSLYNGVDSLTFPNGKTFSPSQLKESKAYARIFDSPHVLFGDNGIVSSIVSLDKLKKSYGIEEQDAEAAFRLLTEAIEDEKEKIEAHNRAYENIIPVNATATAELGVHTATGLESAAELGTLAATGMEGTAELGATVAALEARIAALESLEKRVATLEVNEF